MNPRPRRGVYIWGGLALLLAVSVVVLALAIPSPLPPHLRDSAVLALLIGFLLLSLHCAPFVPATVLSPFIIGRLGRGLGSRWPWLLAASAAVPVALLGARRA